MIIQCLWDGKISHTESDDPEKTTWSNFSLSNIGTHQNLTKKEKNGCKTMISAS